MSPTEPTPVTNTELRKFGLIMAVFIALLFGLLLPWLFGAETWPRWPWILAAGFAIPALLYPPVLHYPFKGWMAFGRIAGAINSRIVLGLLFFAIFLPIGFVMRLFGYDPLFRRLNADSDSYRVVSRQRDPKHFERPF